LDEYEDVLLRAKFAFDAATVRTMLNELRMLGIYVEPAACDFPMPDDDDRVFYETAYAVGAYLITGNSKHYPQEDKVVTPSQFLACF
jgi:predicted nucleic acid-binding protein